MKTLKAFGTPLSRTQMKKVNGGTQKDIIAGCSPKACNAKCMAEAGFGGQCHNGSCYCLG